jgi:carboxymethylenebutenolidase
MPITPQLISFPGRDRTTLHGFMYVPPGPGSFPALLWNHGSEKLPGKQEILAEFYTGHDYVFFIPHRHGQGESSSAGDYIMDLENLMRDIGMGTSSADEFDVRIQGWYNRDVLAALVWLRQQSSVDHDRVYVSGVSFGGPDCLDRRAGSSRSARIRAVCSWGHVVGKRATSAPATPGVA